MTWNRRQVLAGSASIVAAACVPVDQSSAGRLVAKLKIIEAAAGGTLGATFLNTSTGMSIGINHSTRFGHCSSFKFSLAAMTLWRDEQGLDDAERHVTWTQDDLMFVSPFTTRKLDEGATLRELAEFTQKYSDNAAANILLREFGGPPALTEFWRMVGDDESRLDRTEPALNNVPPGELRDTTTPDAMARTVSALCFGDTLSNAGRRTLKQWMMDTPTGARRVRAGLPEDWVAGDKTGTSIWPGMGSLYVDIGFVEPPNRPPLTFATYYRARETHQGMDPASQKVLADAGSVLAEFAAL